MGKFALAQVVHHVVVPLARGAFVRSGCDPGEKHLEHIPHLREAEDTRLQPRFLSGQIGNGTHQIVGQHRHLDFLSDHFRARASQFVQPQRALQVAQIHFDVPTLPIHLYRLFGRVLQDGE